MAKLRRLGQIRPGSTTVDRVDDLGPLGVGTSVGACAFVPPGRPGAGRPGAERPGVDRHWAGCHGAGRPGAGLL